MNDNNENKTMLPNNLFQPVKDTKSLIQEFPNYKLLLVMDYLHVYTNRFGVSVFSLEDMITYYGLRPKTGKGKMNEQFKDIIEFLQFKNIIVDCNLDIKQIKLNQIVRCKYDGIKKNNKGENIEFTTVRYEAMDWILYHEDDSIDNIKLLFYYCYLCSRIHTPKGNDNDIRKNGGRANPAYPSYKTITSDIGIADDTIKQYNDILVKMNLIRIGNLGRAYYSDDKNKIAKETPNFYTHYTYQPNGAKDQDTIWYANLKQAMDVYKKEHNNLVFIGTREYKNNDRHITGFITRIGTLEKEGKAKPEQIEKRNSLVESKNYKEETIISIKEQIQDINERLLEADVNETNKDLKAEIQDYFDDNDKSLYNIEDCKEILKYMKELEIICSSKTNNYNCAI